MTRRRSNIAAVFALGKGACIMGYNRFAISMHRDETMLWVSFPEDYWVISVLCRILAGIASRNIRDRQHPVPPKEHTKKGRKLYRTLRRWSA